jgi:hypothetical protein
MTAGAGPWAGRPGDQDSPILFRLQAALDRGGEVRAKVALTGP